MQRQYRFRHLPRCRNAPSPAVGRQPRDVQVGQVLQHDGIHGGGAGGKRVEHGAPARHQVPQRAGARNVVHGGRRAAVPVAVCPARCYGRARQHCEPALQHLADAQVVLLKPVQERQWLRRQRRPAHHHHHAGVGVHAAGACQATQAHVAQVGVHVVAGGIALVTHHRSVVLVEQVVQRGVHALRANQHNQPPCLHSALHACLQLVHVRIAGVLREVGHVDHLHRRACQAVKQQAQCHVRVGVVNDHQVPERRVVGRLAVHHGIRQRRLQCGQRLRPPHAAVQIQSLQRVGPRSGHQLRAPRALSAKRITVTNTRHRGKKGIAHAAKGVIRQASKVAAGGRFHRLAAQQRGQRHEASMLCGGQRAAADVHTCSTGAHAATQRAQQANQVTSGKHW